MNANSELSQKLIYAACAAGSFKPFIAYPQWTETDRCNMTLRLVTDNQ
jgi:hypothetical protein